MNYCQFVGDSCLGLVMSSVCLYVCMFVCLFAASLWRLLFLLVCLSSGQPTGICFLTSKLPVWFNKPACVMRLSFHIILFYFLTDKFSRYQRSLHTCIATLDGRRTVLWLTVI